MRSCRFSLLGALVACGCLWFSAQASAYVYWSNAGTNTIGRANLDGTAANESFIGGAHSPFGIAVNGQYVYWSNSNGTIGRANLDGSGANQSFITGAHSAGGIAVNGQYIYWANGSSNTIGRANLNGTGVNQSFITGASVPTNVAVNSQYIYWSNDDYPSNISIARANLSGTGVNENFIEGAGAEQIALNSQYIYWADFQAGEIRRANLSGTGSTGLVATAGAPAGVAVDGSYVYWDNSFAGSGGTIGRAALNGSDPNQSFISGPDVPGNIAVDSGTGPEPSTCNSQHLILPKDLDNDLDITGCFTAGSNGTFVSTGNVNVNGIYFEPAAGGTITIDPGDPSLKASGDGLVEVGGVVPIWGWSGQMSIPLSGEITLQNDVSAKLFGFPIDGSLKAEFTGDDANLTGDVEFRLAEVDDIDAAVTISTDNPQGLAGAGIELKGADEAPGHSDGEKCTPGEEPPAGFSCGTTVTYNDNVYHGLVPLDPSIIHIGPVGVEDLQLSYDPAGKEWSGGGTIALDDVFPSLENTLPALGVHVTIGTSPFQLDGFSANDSDLDHWIGPVDLQQLSFMWQRKPFGLGGDVGLRTDGGVAIDGGFDYERGKTSGFQLKVNGTVGLSDVTTLSGFVLFNDEDGGGEIGLGGAWERTFGPAWAKLGVSGGVAWNPKHNWAWEVDGDGSAGIFGAGIQAHGVISNAGAGACGEESVFGFHVQIGFRHPWNGNTDYDGCDFSGLHTVGQGSAASASVGRSVRIRRGVSKEEFAIVGASSPPVVTLAGPDGESLSTPTVPNQITPTPQGLELAVSDTNTTYLTVVHPRAGRWTITPAAGSAPPIRYEFASPLEPLHLKVGVVGTGHRRILSWKFKAQPGVTVAFTQTGGTETLITSTGHGRGRTRFALAAGRGGIRHVTATVSVDGFPRQVLTVARFRAPWPKLPRVSSASYTLKKGTLKLKWTRVRHAVSYEVEIHFNKGMREYLVTGRQRSVKFVLGTLKVRRVSITTITANMTGHAVVAKKVKPQRRRKRHRR
jgi:Domain of unknown function (DUF5050)